MNETSIKVLDLKISSERSVRFRTRCFAYAAIWLLAGLAFWVFVGPDGPTETNLTQFQQLVRLPLELPLIAWLGLARASASIWPQYPVIGPAPFARSAVGLASVACFITVAVLTLTRRRLHPLVAMLCLHAAILSVSLIFYVRLAAELSASP
jgi:hypothetical protein